MTGGFHDYLWRPRRLEENLADMEERLEEIWAVCTKMSANLNQIGGHSAGGGDAKDGTYAAYSDFRQRYNRKKQALDDAENEMLAFLQYVEWSGGKHSRRDAVILRWRYAYRMDWEFIHRKLAICGFRCRTLRTVFNWHKDALIRVEKIWEETHGQDVLPAAGGEDCEPLWSGEPDVCGAGGMCGTDPSHQ